MSNFKNELRILGSKESQQKMFEDLKSLGYRSYNGGNWNNHYHEIQLNHRDHPNTYLPWGFAPSPQQYIGIPLTLNADILWEKEAILALACQREGDQYFENEWVVVDKEEDRFYTRGLLYQLGGKFWAVNNNRGFYTKEDNFGDPNGQMTFDYHKASTEEIIAWFKKKHGVITIDSTNMNTIISAHKEWTPRLNDKVIYERHGIYTKKDESKYIGQRGTITFISGDLCVVTFLDDYEMPSVEMKKQLTPINKNTQNMDKEIIGYNLKKEYSNLYKALERALDTTFELSLNQPYNATTRCYNDEMAQLGIKDYFEPVYEPEKPDFVTINLGSQDEEVTIYRDGDIKFKDECESCVDDIKDLVSAYLRVGSGSKIGGFSLNFLEDVRFLRIGCADENHTFSIEELNQVIQTHNKLNA